MWKNLKWAHNCICLRFKTDDFLFLLFVPSKKMTFRLCSKNWEWHLGYVQTISLNTTPYQDVLHLTDWQASPPKKDNKHLLAHSQKCDIWQDLGDFYDLTIACKERRERGKTITFLITLSVGKIWWKMTKGNLKRCQRPKGKVNFA